MLLIIWIVCSHGYFSLLAAPVPGLILVQILFTVYCTFGFLAIKYGAGRHVSNILPEDLSRALIFWFMCE
jgi:hypothetical protein